LTTFLLPQAQPNVEDPLRPLSFSFNDSLSLPAFNTFFLYGAAFYSHRSREPPYGWIHPLFQMMFSASLHAMNSMNPVYGLSPFTGLRGDPDKVFGVHPYLAPSCLSQSLWNCVPLSLMLTHLMGFFFPLRLHRPTFTVALFITALASLPSSGFAKDFFPLSHHLRRPGPYLINL